MFVVDKYNEKGVYALIPSNILKILYGYKDVLHVMRIDKVNIDKATISIHTVTPYESDFGDSFNVLYHKLKPAAELGEPSVFKIHKDCIDKVISLDKDLILAIKTKQGCIIDILTFDMCNTVFEDSIKNTFRVFYGESCLPVLDLE